MSVHIGENLMKKITIITLLLILFYSNSVLAASSPIENGAFPTADIDQDGSIDALTDGLLTLRYLFGLRGQTLIANTTSPSCTRCSVDQITTYLATAVENKVFDCDGNNIVDALTDGLLFVRYLFGFSGNPLVENVVGPGAQHTTSEALQECLNTLTILTDMSPPQISLLGDNPITITVGSTYEDSGATATDLMDGSVAVVIDTSAVNTGVAGDYLVQFSATDLAGNRATDTRNVQVINSPVLSGVISQWLFDDGSGVVAANQTANSPALTINNTNAANWVSGVSGTALNFNGTNQYASADDARSLQTNSVSLAAWVMPDQSSVEWEWIAAQADNYGLFIRPSSGTVVFYIKNDGSGKSSVSSPDGSLSFNRWQHIAGSFDASSQTLKVYINGIEVGSQVIDQAIGYSTGDGFTVGSMQNHRFFDGNIDEAHVYSRALTETELSELVNSYSQIPGGRDTNDGSTYKILPLGDSITDSYAGRPSYRRTLWKLLVDAGYTVDFVGNETTTNIDSSFQDFDLNHEGHPGWEAGDIDDQINEWLTNISPDIVLLHIGTNDLDRGQSYQSTLNEIDSLIQKLRIKNPNMVIFMAKIIPMRNLDTASFNALLDQFVVQRTTNSSPIFIVDQYTGFDANTDNYDNYHPNEIGENKIATKWFEALQNYFNE
jgi:hypothetical protein